MNPYKQGGGGYPQQQQHGRPYTGPVFTPGGGYHQSSPQTQPMRGPPQGGYPPQQQYQPRGRGPPRSGPHPQQYMPRGAMPQPYYPQMQQIPPYMMGSQPGMNMYMPPAAAMQYYPNMGMPAGGMPVPTHQPQFQVPQKRERKPAEVRDPKTGKLLDLTSTRKNGGEESAAPVEAEAAAVEPKTDTSAAPVAPAAAKAPSSPKKEAKQDNGAPKSPQEKSPAAAAEKPAAAPKEQPAAAAAPANKAEVKLTPATSETKPAPKSPTKTPVKNGAAVTTAAVASPKAAPKEPVQAVKAESPKKKTPATARQESVTSPTKVESKAEKPAAAATKSVSVVAKKVNGKLTYSVDVLLSFREAHTELPAEATGPDSKWPSMEVVNDGPARASSRGGGRGGSNWERSESKAGGSLARQTSRGSNSGGGGGAGGGNQWARSQDLPKRGRGERGGGRGGGGRGGRGQPQEPLFDGPVKPLERTDNRWIPVKATSGLEAAKKKVYSIMNKMTREKFSRLAAQLTDIEMESLEMLQSVITILFDKALGEPHFCDMYADLCVHLEKEWKVWSFLQIVQNDDDNTFYWTTMAEADTEVVGPFESVGEVLESAKSDEFEPSPAPAGMKLSEVRIQSQKFIKVWVHEEESKAKEYYWSGQLLEDLGEDQALNGPFESFEHANRTAIKACSFKRILLNACQEEFEKDNIYEELEETYKKNKLEGNVTPEMEAEYEEKRMIMKARMLGNIRFIGELFRKGMLQERIMHECIMKLMGVAVKDGALALVHPSDNPDEENIESLCKLLSTMGKDLDKKGPAQAAMNSYFTFLEKVLLKDKRLCSRINFMIKDVLDLRLNRWEQRRKELKTMTLDEIRKEAERELQKPPVSAPSGGGGGGGGRSDSSFRRSGSSRDNYSSQGRSTMAPIYSSQSMSSRSSGGNRMQLPNPRGIQRDESVKTGPQGRPASFGGGAGARRGGPSGPSAGTGGSPASFSSRSRNAPSATPESGARSAKKPETPQRAALSDDAKEKIAKRAKSTAEEYVSIVDIAEADACLNELLKEFNSHPEVTHVFAKEILQLASDAKNNVREGMFDLLEKLVLEKKSVTPEGIRFGIEKMVELAVDLWCDVPKLHEHVADILVRFMKESATTGVSFDWLVCGCGNKLEADIFEELVQGGFLAAAAGQTLALLKAASVEKARSEVRATYSTLQSLFAPHDQNATSIQKWITKFALGDVLPLEPAFGLVELANKTSSYDEVVTWIDAHISPDLHTDALFATHTCLFILENSTKGQLPSPERCMLLTGFSGDVETQVRVVSGIFQTRTDSGAYCLVAVGAVAV